MLFWITAALMTAAAILCVLWPLGRDRIDVKSIDRLDVLRDQMNVLERRLESAEGPELDRLEQERAELGRRILQTFEKDTPTSGKTSARAIVAASLFALIAVPAIALPLYAIYGEAGLRDQPLSAHTAKSLETQSVPEMVRVAELHLRDNPNDIRGWEVLARVYSTQDRVQDRARALGNIVRLQPDNVDALTDLGEALTQLADNVVTDRAVQYFDAALKLQPDHRKASFYRTIALEQEGAIDLALTRWRQLQNLEPGNAEWQAVIARQIARLSGSAPAVDPKAAEQISNLDPAARSQMIMSMVSRLEERLREEPDDLVGWERLLRSYAVLGTPEKGLDALNGAINNAGPTSALAARLIALRDQQKVQP